MRWQFQLELQNSEQERRLTTTIFFLGLLGNAVGSMP